MTRRLTCTRCGHEGLDGVDVAAKIVNLEAEAKLDGGRIRDVVVELEGERLRHVTTLPVRVTVPERYGPEYRCRDHRACDARYAELLAGEPAELATDGGKSEEVPPWL